MIELIEGRGVGAGKSYFCIERLFFHWLRGGTAFVSDTVEVKWDACKALARKRHGLVLEDDQYRVISSNVLQTLHEATAGGTAELPVLIIVDEAQDAFNARDWSDKSKRPFFSWLCQSRHDDNDVIVISQALANIDKQIRRLATYMYVIRNSEFFKVGGVTLSTLFRLLSGFLWDGKCFIRTTLDQDGRTVLGKKWVTADRSLFGCYESKSMRQKHRRLAEIVARKKLSKCKRERPMLKYVIPLGFLAAIIAGCQLVKSSFGGKPEKQTAPAVFVAAPASGGKVWKDGEVVRDELRAYTRGYLQTAVHGGFTVGTMHELGRVVAVSRDQAMIEVRPGVRIKVVAYQGQMRAPEGKEKTMSEVVKPKNAGGK